MKKLKVTVKIRAVLLMFMCCTFLIGCAKEGSNNSNSITPTAQPYISKQEFKLNTMVTITIYDVQEEAILEGAMALCDEYEDIFSRTLQGSELYQLNQGLLDSTEDGRYVVSEDLADLLLYAYQYSDLSKGLFDFTIAPITSLWDFTTLDSAIIPDNMLIEEAVKKVNYQNVEILDHTVCFKEKNISIDVGAIAKGYIADRIKDYLLDQGVQSAMINLGGNVLCVGEKPGGVPFKVGIQKPFADRNEVVATMEITDKSVVSSGIYERYFEVNGQIYHHILNPRTGYPFDNDLVSVTIISDLSVDGDGLSTTCFALGLEGGLELINGMEDVYAVFITDDYSIHYSDGFFDAIKVKEIQ